MRVFLISYLSICLSRVANDDMSECFRCALPYVKKMIEMLNTIKNSDR